MSAIITVNSRLKLPAKNWLAIGAIAALPLSTAVTNIFLALAILGVIVDKQALENLRQLTKHPWTGLFFSLFFLALIGAPYSEGTAPDIWAALSNVSKFLFAPFLLHYFQEKLWRERALKIFIAVLLFSAVVGVLKLIFSWNINSHFARNAVFKNHIDGNFLMAFGCFFLIHSLGFKLFNKIQTVLMLAFFIIYLLFLSQGRSGYFLFAIVTVIALVQHQGLRMLGLSILLMLLLLFAAFKCSPAFNRRSHEVLDGILLYQKGDATTSTGERLQFATQTWKLALKKPWFGYGTGSFTRVYGEQVAALKLKNTENPHNEYLNIWVQWGLIGLGFYVAILARIYYLSVALPRLERFIAQGVLLGFAATCFINSWLMDYTPGHFFVFFLVVAGGAYQVRAPKNI